MRIFLAVILLSCAAFAQDEAAIAKAKAACGAGDVKFDFKTKPAAQPPTTPEEGKALIFVIGQVTQAESCDEGSCGIIARVGIDGAWVGAISRGSYLALNATPGEHHLCTNWQSRLASRSRQVGLMNFTAEAGKVYYFRMRVFGTENQFFFDLDPVNADEGKYLIALSPASDAHQKKP